MSLNLEQVWNTLSTPNRRQLLCQCRTITNEAIKDSEARLAWADLLPVLRDELVKMHVRQAASES